MERIDGVLVLLQGGDEEIAKMNDRQSDSMYGMLIGKCCSCSLVSYKIWFRAIIP